MEYILSMVFATAGGKTSTISISGVKETITKEQVIALMDTILAKNIFTAESGQLVSKSNARLTKRQVTKYEIA